MLAKNRTEHREEVCVCVWGGVSATRRLQSTFMDSVILATVFFMTMHEDFQSRCRDEK